MHLLMCRFIFLKTCSYSLVRINSNGVKYNCDNIYFNSAAIFLPPVCASNRFVAIASISSINIIAGAFSLASLNTSLTMRGPSPKYFWTNSEPTTLIKAAKIKHGVFYKT